MRKRVQSYLVLFILFFFFLPLCLHHFVNATGVESDIDDLSSRIFRRSLSTRRTIGAALPPEGQTPVAIYHDGSAPGLAGTVVEFCRVAFGAYKMNPSLTPFHANLVTASGCDDPGRRVRLKVGTQLLPGIMATLGAEVSSRNWPGLVAGAMVHTARSGSTAASNILAHSVPRALVLSEATFLFDPLLLYEEGRLTRTESLLLLRVLAQVTSLAGAEALKQHHRHQQSLLVRRGGDGDDDGDDDGDMDALGFENDPLFVKLPSNTALLWENPDGALGLLSTAWPKARWAFLFRSPVEVMAAQLDDMSNYRTEEEEEEEEAVAQPITSRRGEKLDDSGRIEVSLNTPVEFGKSARVELSRVPCMRSRADPALRRNAYLRTVLLETGLGAQLNARFPVAAYVPSSSNDSSLSSSKTRQAETAESDPDTLLVLNLPMEGYCALHTSAIFKAVALFSARLKERREAERATAEGNDDNDDEMDEEEDQEDSSGVLFVVHHELPGAVVHRLLPHFRVHLDRLSPNRRRALLRRARAVGARDAKVSTSAFPRAFTTARNATGSSDGVGVGDSGREGGGVGGTSSNTFLPFVNDSAKKRKMATAATWYWSRNLVDHYYSQSLGVACDQISRRVNMGATEVEVEVEVGEKNDDDGDDDNDDEGYSTAKQLAAAMKQVCRLEGIARGRAPFASMEFNLMLGKHLFSGETTAGNGGGSSSSSSSLEVCPMLQSARWEAESRDLKNAVPVYLPSSSSSSSPSLPPSLVEGTFKIVAAEAMSLFVAGRMMAAEACWKAALVHYSDAFGEQQSSSKSSSSKSSRRRRRKGKEKEKKGRRTRNGDGQIQESVEMPPVHRAPSARADRQGVLDNLAALEDTVARAVSARVWHGRAPEVARRIPTETNAAALRDAAADWRRIRRRREEREGADKKGNGAKKAGEGRQPMPSVVRAGRGATSVRGRDDGGDGGNDEDDGHTVGLNDLGDAVLTFEHALSDDLCDFVVELFEASAEEHYQGNVLRNNQVMVDPLEKSTVEVEVAASKKVAWQAVDWGLLQATTAALARYEEALPGFSYLPNPLYDDGFRVKRYDSPSPSRTIGGRHTWHVDRSGAENCRELAVIIYLNDLPPGSGGETLFLTPQARLVVPKKGTILLFPAAPTHVHSGANVVGNDAKYIITNFLSSCDMNARLQRRGVKTALNQTSLRFLRSFFAAPPHIWSRPRGDDRGRESQSACEFVPSGLIRGCGSLQPHEADTTTAVMHAT